MDPPVSGLGQRPKATNESKLGHARARAPAAPPSMPQTELSTEVEPMGGTMETHAVLFLVLLGSDPLRCPTQS